MKKIMFNDRYGLTQAVLDGRKTMTRREVNIKSLLDFVADDIRHCFDGGTGGFQALADRYARYKVGEVVAVAQSYKDCRNIMPETRIKGLGVNDGLWIMAENHAGWNNKMFVQADLMPHHIRITNIRVERLQDISDEDCLREGIKVVNHPSNIKDVYYAFPHQDSDLPYRTARTAFAKLIDKVSGKGTWERNPYVFVYEFEKVD